MKLPNCWARKLAGGSPKKKAPHTGLKGEQRLFLAACQAHGLPEPVAEYPWGSEAPRDPKTGKLRKWRFDYLFSYGGYDVAVEIIGGVWTGGHHSGGQSQIDDMERRNEAQILEYVVLEFTREQADKGECFPTIRRALGI